jgi:ABC-type multidrug transport system ATPase subunit
MLMSLTEPTSGIVKVAGRDCVTESLAVKRKIGVVSEVMKSPNLVSVAEGAEPYIMFSRIRQRCWRGNDIRLNVLFATEYIFLSDL